MRRLEFSVHDFQSPENVLFRGGGQGLGRQAEQQREPSGGMPGQSRAAARMSRSIPAAGLKVGVAPSLLSRRPAQGESAWYEQWALKVRGGVCGELCRVEAVGLKWSARSKIFQKPTNPSSLMPGRRRP